MKKRSIQLERPIGEVITLLFLCFLGLMVTMMPIADAETLSVTLNPSQGPPGATVLTVIAGFTAPTTLSIAFGTTSVRTITASMYSTLSMDFRVPDVSPGTYTVTVTSTTGGMASTTFTVTQRLLPTHSPEEIPTNAPEETPIWQGPTSNPVIKESGFWSPLTIGIVAAATALASTATFLYIRHIKQEAPLVAASKEYKYTSSIEERSSHKPGSPIKQVSSYSYGPPASPVKSTTPTRNQIAFDTKVCRHCKQNVRNDLNVCPHCFKRLR